MLKGFRDFIMRGNVIELAIGVVIGVAFTNVVTAFTSAFITPLILAVGGPSEVKGSFTVNGAVFNWGAFLTALIAFLITAAVVYFLIVLPMNKLAERRKSGEEPPPAAPSEEVQLLTEIRDALVARRDNPDGGTPARRAARAEREAAGTPPTRPESVS
jgi:large conductance mechanosensitive channel